MKKKMQHYCRTCKINKICYTNWKYGKGRCESCSKKGKLHNNWKGGITSKKYYCKEKDCNNEIGLCSGLYGSGLCRSCGSKGKIFSKNHLKNMRLVNLGKHSGKKNPMFGKIGHHGKSGKYKNIWMRSSWELNFARFLTLSNIRWQYESKTFDLKNTTYTPDFYLPKFDLHIEIKGFWRTDAKKKFRKFRRLYKNIRIEVLNKNKLKEIGVL